MAVSPEAVVRDYLACWEHPDATRIASFLNEDAVYVDGTGTEYRGSDAIRAEFERMLVLGGQGVSIDVKHLAVDGPVVMVEHVDRFAIGERSFALELVGVFQIGADGTIDHLREYYDEQGITQQLRDAGFDVT
jgi:limonene-1,2-epoxide hydrolase